MNRRVAIVAASLLVAIAAVFLQAARHEFVEFDDPIYVRDNAQVRRGLDAHGLTWAFTSRDGLFHPLTWTTYMLEVELFGADAPGVHAVTDVALHAASALMLLAFLLLATGRLTESAIVSALFALHPVQVEPVTWISGRKDVLCGLFFFAMLLAYTRRVRAREPVRVWPVAVLLALGLLSKGVVATAPAVLLLLDAWPLARAEEKGGGLRRWGELALEKWPLFALCAASVVLSMRIAAGADNLWIEDPPLLARLWQAPIHYLFYLEKLLWPVGLTIAYPSPEQMGAAPWSPWRGAASGLVLAALSVACFRLRRRAPAIWIGWLWFAGMLLPMSGIVPNGLRMPQDRYLYLPSVGFFIAVVFGASQLARSFGLTITWRRLGTAAACAALLACALLSFRQVGLWRDSERLFAHALAVTERNAVVHYSRGIALAHAGRDDQALAELDVALDIHPRHFPARTSRGYLLQLRGDTAGAIAEYRAALDTEPDYVQALINLGDLLARSGEHEEALVHLRRAAVLAPESANAHYALALGLETSGHADEALAQFGEAQRIDPRHVGALLGLARRLQAAGRTRDAERIDTAVLAIDPGQLEAGSRRVLRRAFSSRADQREAAIALAEELVAQSGDRAEAHHILAIALSEAGRTGEAALSQQKAIDLLSAEQAPLAAEYRRSLERYRAGLPYRAPSVSSQTPGAGP